MHPAVTNGAYDVNRIRADFPILVLRFMASRWSISTTPRRRKSRKCCSRPDRAAYTSQYANVHRGLHYLANEATEAYESAREKVAAFLNAGAQGRDHLHPQRDRGDQSRRLYVRARAHQAGRRDHALDHGAPLQHRALAFPARAAGCGDQVGAGRRRGQFSRSTNSRS